MTEKKIHKIELRVTERQKNRIRGLTRLYGYDSMTEWILTLIEEHRPLFKASNK